MKIKISTSFIIPERVYIKIYISVISDLMVDCRLSSMNLLDIAFIELLFIEELKKIIPKNNLLSRNLQFIYI